MGGAKLCSLIRNDASLKNVSIIVVCNATDASLAQCRETGANARHTETSERGYALFKNLNCSSFPSERAYGYCSEYPLKAPKGILLFSPDR